MIRPSGGRGQGFDSPLGPQQRYSSNFFLLCARGLLALPVPFLQFSPESARAVKSYAGFKKVLGGRLQVEMEGAIKSMALSGHGLKNIDIDNPSLLLSASTLAPPAARTSIKKWQPHERGRLASASGREPHSLHPSGPGLQQGPPSPPPLRPRRLLHLCHLPLCDARCVKLLSIYSFMFPDRWVARSRIVQRCALFPFVRVVPLLFARASGAGYWGIERAHHPEGATLN